jgi:hypothetical protein
MLRLRITLPAESTAVLLVTRTDPTLPVSPTLSAEELATATAFAIPLDSNGNLDFKAPTSDLPGSGMATAGLRFRVAFFDASIGGLAITDPIAVITTSPPETPTPIVGAAAQLTTNAVATAVAGSATAIAGSTVTATTGPGASSTAAGATSNLQSASTSASSTQTTQPQPTTSKTNFSAGKSFSLPSVGTIPFRLLTNHSLISTHDQPSPIQGSGH